MKSNFQAQLEFIFAKIKNDSRPLSPTANLSFKEKLLIIDKINETILTLKKGEIGDSKFKENN